MADFTQLPLQSLKVLKSFHVRSSAPPELKKHFEEQSQCSAEFGWGFLKNLSAGGVLLYWEALASVSKLLATALHLPHESPPRGGVCPFIALVEGDVMFCPAAALLPGAL